MIRRISSLALGVAIACFATSALAQEEGGEAAPAEEAAAPAEPAAGGGEAAAGGTAAASTDALPAGKGAFGKSGQIAISQDLELKFESRSSKPPDPPGGDAAKTTTITIGPALDYFVADSISIGGKIVFTSVSGDGPEGSTIGIGPRVGYNLGLTDNLSLWPKLSFTYAMTTIKNDPDDIKLTKMILGVDVPLLIHPAEHFFVGIGPYLELDISSKQKVGDADGDGNKDTAFGARTVVGGWF